MNGRKLAIGTAVMVLALGGSGAAIAAQQAQQDDAPDTGSEVSEQAAQPDIEKARNIALDHTDGGRVTGTEVEDEEGYYEIEVTRDDGGGRVDVHLDRDFDVLGTRTDHEGPDDD